MVKIINKKKEKRELIRLVCNNCNTKTDFFLNKSKIIKHVNNNNIIKQYNCPKCGKLIETKI